MKNFIFIGLFFILIGAYSEVITVKNGELEFVTPQPGSSKLNFGYNVLPLSAVCSLDDNKIQIRRLVNSGVSMTLISNHFKPGKQKLRIKAKSYSEKAVMKLNLNVFGMHFSGDGCNGNSGRNNNIFEYKMELDNSNKIIEFPFELTEKDLICERCDKILSHCRIFTFLKLDESPIENIDYDNYGVEISTLEFDMTFPGVIFNKKQGSSLSWLDTLLQCETNEQLNWQKKRLDVFSQRSKNNKFNAETQLDFPKNNKKEQEFSLFDIEQLNTLNPSFEVKEIVSLPFYEYGQYQKNQKNFCYLRKIKKAFIRNNIVYAVGDNFVCRWNSDVLDWEYIIDDETSSKIRKPVKKFSDNTNEILLYKQKVVRLADGAKITTPPNVSNAIGQYALTANAIYYIAEGRKNILVVNSDSEVQTLNLQLPEFPKLKMIEIREIYASNDEKRLLIEYFAALEYNNITVLVEVDLATGKGKFKLPVYKDYYYINDSSNSSIVYASFGTLFDLGAGSRLAMLSDNDSNAIAKKMGLVKLHIPSALSKILNQSQIIGSYAVAANENARSILFINLFKPQESLQLNGFENFISISAISNEDKILIVMPNGLYEVRPKNIPEKPKFELPSATAHLPPKLDISKIITSIEADTPALFNAEFDKDELVFSIKPSQSSKIILHLKFPEVATPPEYYLFSFDKNAMFISGFNPENALGERDASIWQDYQTLRVKSDSIKLNITLSYQTEESTIRLKSIEPKEEKIK